MYPATFEYTAPETLQETMKILAANTGAKILAGGQSLLPSMKQRLLTPPMLVDIGRVQDFLQVREDHDTILIGPKLTQADAAVHATLQKEIPLLAQAASWVADRQVRRMGTVCGAIANAESTSDVCCATLSLGGTILARSIDGAREIAADHFFIDGHQTALHPHEVLVAIRLRKRQAGEGWGYDKLGVRGGHSGWAITGAAAWIKMEAGIIRAARVAISGASHVTTLAQQAAAHIIGTNGSASVLGEAARIAGKEVESMADMNGSVAYKQQLVQVYTRRALQQAIRTAQM